MLLDRETLLRLHSKFDQYQKEPSLTDAKRMRLLRNEFQLSGAQLKKELSRPIPPPLVLDEKVVESYMLDLMKNSAMEDQNKIRLLDISVKFLDKKKQLTHRQELLEELTEEEIAELFDEPI